MSERELPREVAAALKALDQAESLAAEYAAIRGEDDEVAATKIRAVAMNLERWALASRQSILEEAAKKIREVGEDWEADGQFTKNAAAEYLESCIRSLSHGKAPAKEGEAG